MWHPTKVLLPSPRVLKPRILVALAWIGSLLLVYHCCRFVTHKVYVDIERALVQPKESPPLLGYLLLLRYYSSFTSELQELPPVEKSFKVQEDHIRLEMRKHRCTPFNHSDQMPNITEDTFVPLDTVCRHKPTKHFLTLFTTMYDRKDKIFIFNNTITMWPQVHGIKPVLFLTPSSDSSPAMVTMVTQACNLGWDVVVAPHCNNDSYPVLRSMWHVIMHNYDSTFYGYTNGDIVFDNTLTLTLRHLITQDPHVFKRKHMISGQRHNAYVCILTLFVHHIFILILAHSAIKQQHPIVYCQIIAFIYDTDYMYFSHMQMHSTEKITDLGLDKYLCMQVDDAIY